MICWVRTAILIAASEGMANASSSELVCSDWVPPNTAASAWIAVRATLLIGCCAVSETPEVWQWARISHERGSVQRRRSRIIRAHSRRAARSLETSSRKSLWTFQKNDTRGARRSGSIPRSRAASR